MFIWANAPTVNPALPKAVRPVASDVPVIMPVPVPPVPIAQPVVQQHIDLPAAKVPELDDDDYELDMAMLNLPQIKNLNLDAETAADAIEAEQSGRQRKDVLAYLATLTDKELASRVV